MGKYDKLGRYLSNLKDNKVILSFERIEEILGFKLPESARKYPPWWANDKSHSQAKDGWLRYGWETLGLNFNERTIQFSRFTRKAESAQKDIPRYRGKANDAREFEVIGRKLMSDYFKTRLDPGEFKGIPKLFDYKSEDDSIVGDSKFYTLVRGRNVPPAKFSTIAEHVWLLEKVPAKNKFLLFGNQKEVPAEWLKRYGHLVTGIKFFFASCSEGKWSLEELN